MDVLEFCYESFGSNKLNFSVVKFEITFKDIPSKKEMSYVPLIAYIIDLIATLLQQYGYLLQKKTHLKNENTRMSGYYLLDP